MPDFSQFVGKTTQRSQPQPVQRQLGGLSAVTQPKEFLKQIFSSKRLTGAVEGIKGSFERAGEKFSRAREEFAQPGANIFSAPRAAMATLGAAGEVAASPIVAGIGLFKPELEETVSQIAAKIPQSAKDKASELIEQIPEEDRAFISDTFSALGLFVAPAMAKTGVRAVKGAIRKPVQKIGQAVEKVGEFAGKPKVPVSEKILNTKIDEAVEKGIRPSIAGRKGVQQLEAYNTKARDAIKTIVKNKDKIELIDDVTGETIGLPQNLKQASDALNQTKKIVFQQYDDLQKAAGQAGQQVELKGIVDELAKVKESKVLQDLKPGVVKYVDDTMSRLSTRGVYTTQEAQDAIKALNDSLSAFYRNPTYDNFAKANIDSMIVNNLRKNLDDIIMNSTGEQYQVLKNQYSSLKTIEKDLFKRALVDSRKNARGLLDFTDIFSAGEIVGGLTTFNPAMIAKGITQKSIKEFFKKLNDPNFIIKNMFKRVDDFNTKSLVKGNIAKKITSKQLKPLTNQAKQYDNFDDFVNAMKKSDQSDDILKAFTKTYGAIESEEALIKILRNIYNSSKNA